MASVGAAANVGLRLSFRDSVWGSSSSRASSGANELSRCQADEDEEMDKHLSQLILTHLRYKFSR